MLSDLLPNPQQAQGFNLNRLKAFLVPSTLILYSFSSFVTWIVCSVGIID